MKKVTLFFLAFMPFFVIILLFISGMIVKNNVHIYVSSVEISEQDTDIKKEDETKEVQMQFHANVLPKNATNPDVTWSTSDENIITVDDTGLVTCKDYGEAYLYITSKENPTLTGACKVDVWDDKIHSIAVSNKYDVGYVGVDSTSKINVSTKPTLTHVTDPTIEFKVTTGSDVIDVAKDGTIIPKTSGDAKVEVTAKATGKTTDVPVYVGIGIDALSLDNPTKEIISDTHYNLFDHLQTAPEAITSKKITATDFNYECDSPSLANISESGYIDFFLPGTATFTASYKRNTNLKVTKTIECTCNYLKQVYFNQSEVSVELDESKLASHTQTIDADKLGWYVYPFNGERKHSRDADGVVIRSSDDNVIEVREGNANSQLVVKGAGSCTLYAEISTQPNKYKLDTCQVNVTLPTSSDTIEITTDSCYYPLRNAMPIAKGIEYKENVEYSTDAECAYILTGDEIIHFTKAGTATVTATMASGNTRTINITSSAKLTELSIQDTIVIPAGQKTKITGYTPIWTWESYRDKFDHNDDGEFIAKFGQDIEEFELEDESGNTKKIHLIVTEAPQYIASDTNTRYFTNDYEIDVPNTIAAKIMPETATMSTGRKYQLDYTYYDPIGDAPATVEDDIATFTKVGAIEAIAISDGESAQDTLTQTFTIHSSYGDQLDKFKITDADDKTYESYGEPIVLSQANSQTLYCKDVTRSLYDDIDISSTTGLCTVSKKWVSGSLFSRGHIEFTIKAPERTYGRDVIEFRTNAYASYIYVDVKAGVTDFVVSRGTDVLSDTGSNLTHTKNLKFKVIPTPCVVEGQEITVKFNDQTVELKDNYITLPSDAFKENSDNTLLLSCGSFDKQYTIRHSSADPNFWLDGAEEGLYLSMNATQKVSEVKTDGFVDDDWYSKMEISFTKTKEDYTFTSKFLSIYNISPTIENYENEIVLKSGSVTKTYTMGRDVVSKIVFPKHDNADMTDKKGLQKVHVYGDHSYYAEEKQEVDYYKLPVLIYGQNRKLITNTEAKPTAVIDALRTLKASFGNAHSTYELTNDGYIKIKFAKSDLYTRQEIADDKFDAKQNKNVTFSLSTKSNDASAKYTFVALEGVNQYCQEGLRASTDGKLENRVNILQINFGLPEGAKDNAKLDDKDLFHFGYIFGNGYTFSINDITFAGHGNVKMQWIINATIEGMHDEKLSWDVEESRMSNDNQTENVDWIYEYSIIKNFKEGIYLDEDVVKDRIMKRCIFTGNLFNAMQATSKGTVTHLEDNIFFNCGSFGFMQANGPITYIKGFMEVYNFHSKEMLQHIQGLDLRFLWSTLVDLVKLRNGVHTGADGRDYINSSLLTFNSAEVYFFNPDTQQYEVSTHGFKSNAEHIYKLIDMQIKIAKLEAGFWGTRTSDADPTGPSYYDEYNTDGTLRLDFLQNQIKKVVRQINYF